MQLLLSLAFFTAREDFFNFFKNTETKRKKNLIYTGVEMMFSKKQNWVQQNRGAFAIVSVRGGFFQKSSIGGDTKSKEKVIVNSVGIKIF